MKIASCLCGLIRGFCHDLKCRVCCTYPWQHSSDEEFGEESSSEEAWRIEIRRRVNEEIEEEQQRKYDSAKQTIADAEFYAKVQEDRAEEENTKIFQKLKDRKKKLMTRSQHDKRRLNRTQPEEQFFHLDVYNHYKQKAKYEENELCQYFSSIMLEGKYNADRFMATGYSIEEFNLQCYDDKLKEQANA